MATDEELTWRHHKTNCLLRFKLQLQFATRKPERRKCQQSWHNNKFQRRRHPVATFYGIFVLSCRTTLINLHLSCAPGQRFALGVKRWHPLPCPLSCMNWIVSYKQVAALWQPLQLALAGTWGVCAMPTQRQQTPRAQCAAGLIIPRCKFECSTVASANKYILYTAQHKASVRKAAGNIKSNWK